MTIRLTLGLNHPKYSHISGNMLCKLHYLNVFVEQIFVLVFYYVAQLINNNNNNNNNTNLYWYKTKHLDNNKR